MSDFTTFDLAYNTATTDSGASFTGSHLTFGGSSGANELRWSPSTGTTTTTTFGSMPYVTRPASGTATVPQLWAFTADNGTTGTGLQVQSYGTVYSAGNGNNLVLYWNWDNLGTFAAAPQFSVFNTTSHTTPTTDGSIAGGSADTGSSGAATVGYIKINAFGYGVDTGGTQQTPANAGAGGSGDIRTTTLSVTSGTAGAVSPATSAWLSNWQSASGWVQYIIDAVIPKATTAGKWYWNMVLYVGVGASTGTALTPVVTLQYAYA